MADVVLDNYVLDNGISVLDTLADKIFICSQEPTTYTEASSTYALGNKNFGVGAVFAAPAGASPDGRQVTTVAITDGSVTANGTVARWAVVDSVNSRLYAQGALTGGKAVTNGQTFALDSFTIRMPGLG